MKINYQRATAKVKAYHTKHWSEHRGMFEDIINYDNVPSADFETEVIQEVFKKKGYLELNKKEKELLANMLRFSFSLEWRTIRKTFDYMIKERRR